MKNYKMKKQVSILLALVMVLGIAFSFPATSNAQSLVWVNMDVESVMYARSIASDSTGAIYVGGDTSVANVSKIMKLSGGVWTDITGNANIDEADGIVIDSKGNVYVTDGDARQVLKGSHDIDNGWVWNVISDDFAGSFTRPYGIAVDKDDNVYVTDGNNKKLKKYTYDAQSNTGSWSEITNGGVFEWPVDIVVDNNYNMFVVDENGDMIKEYSDRDEDGTSEWVDIAGAAEFSTPTGIIMDTSGNLYVSCQGGVKKGVLNNGTWEWNTVTALNDDYPSGVALDNAENIYYIANDLKTLTRAYDVTFDKNGGDVDSNPTVKTVITGNSVDTLPTDPTREDYIFTGWNTMADGSGNTFTANTVVTADMTLYAQWTEIPMYTITIDPAMSGGTITADHISAYEGEYISLTIQPEAGRQLEQESLIIYDDDETSIEWHGFTMPAHNVVISADFVTSSQWDYIEDTANFGFITSIEEDAFGNLYATIYGGNSDDRLMKYNGSNWTDITWTDDSDDKLSIGDIEIDGSGNAYVYDYNNDLVKKYSSGTWSDVADISSYGDEDSPLTYCVDSFGTIYTVDFEDSKIIKYTSNAWVDICSYDSNDIGLPLQLAVYDTGNFYMAAELDYDYSGILEYKNGAWSSDPIGYYLYWPTIDVDASGNIYTVDGDNNDVMKYSGGEWFNITGDGNFMGSMCIAEGATGHIIVSDSGGIWVASKNYTVTFNKNSGDTESIPATKTAFFGGDVGTLPNEPTKSGYTFNGWNTAADGSGTAFDAKTVITGGITVYAQWKVKQVTPTGGGDTSSGTPSNAGNGSTPVNGTALADVKSDTNGNATATVTDHQIKDAVGKAMATVTHTGEGTKAIVEIKADAPKDTKSVETDIPRTAFDLVADSNVNALVISTPIASLTFDDKALDTIAGQKAGDIKITVSKADLATLSEDARLAVGDKPVFEFSVSCGDSTISQFGGNVTVSVPYTPKAGEDTNAIVIYYINSKGVLEMVSQCAYNPETGMITFDTNHFSKYAVGYNKLNFNDVAENAWYSEAISFIAARGIVSSTGNGNFSPEAKVSRAQFLISVMNAYGLKPDENPKDNFADAGNTYYTGYLAAAKRLGITKGTGNNYYSPDQEITRQEAVMLLYNILKVIGELPKESDGMALETFADSKSVAPWAKDAMMLFTASGIISGSNGKIQPQDLTSRAQMAQILYNLLSK